MTIHKDIGTCELVYCTITNIGEMVAGKRKIDFKHLSGKKADHTWSTDKNRYANCYADLEEGNNYLIVTKYEAKDRWIWKRFWVLTKKELGIVYKLCGLAPSIEQLEEALLVIKEIRNPVRVKTLEDAAETLIF